MHTLVGDCIEAAPAARPSLQAISERLVHIKSVLEAELAAEPVQSQQQQQQQLLPEMRTSGELRSYHEMSLDVSPPPISPFA